MGLLGCIMLTGAVLFPRTPRRKREACRASFRARCIKKDEAAEEKEALRREYEDARKKEKDDLKLHQYVDQIRVALGGQFKAVKESGCPVCKRLIEILDGRNLSEGQDS